MMDESCVMEAGGTGVVAVRLEDFWNPVILACHSRRHHHDHHHGNCFKMLQVGGAITTARIAAVHETISRSFMQL